MRKLKIGIIGMGRMGKTHLKLIYNYFPYVNVKAVCDIKFDNEAKELIKAFKIRDKYTDYSELLEDRLIDIVYICTPVGLLTKISRDAILKKKHVFCEENLSKSLEEIVSLQKVLNKSHVKFQVGLNKRFDNNFISVRESLKMGKIGDANIIKITSRDPDLPPLEYLETSGGLFFDMTVNDFDMIRFLTGDEIEEVYAMGNVLVDEIVKKYDDIDTATINVKLKNGVLCVIDNSRRAVYGYDQRVEVHGTLGMVMTSNELQSKAKIYTNYGVIEEKPQYYMLERYKQSYINESEHFFQSILENKTPIVGCKDALQSLLAAYAAIKSFKENRPVKISEIEI